MHTDYDYGPNVAVERFFHAFFFATLAAALSAEGDFSVVMPGIDKINLGWMGEALKHLEQAARHVGQKALPAAFDTIFLEIADLAASPIQHRPSDPATAQHRAFCVALREIAYDLHCLGGGTEGAGQVPESAFEIARASVHWDDEAWIGEELERRLPLIAPQAINSLVAELELHGAKTITEFNQRAEAWIDLAKLAMLYELPSAARFVSRATDCMIGYGHRKDVWIFDVLGSIENIQDKGSTNAVPWLKKLAPIIDKITDFTDGKETHHAPFELIERLAQATPDLLPRLYAHYIDNDEWRLAEKVLAAYLQVIDFEGEAAQALAATLLENADLDELSKAREKSVPGARTALTRQRQFLGSVAIRKREPGQVAKAKKKSEVDAIGRRGKPPSVQDFGPTDFTALIDRLSRRDLGFEHRDKALLGWLRHWDKQNKGVAALKSIDQYFTTTRNPYPAEHILDEAFEICLRNEGKQAAYKWLVRAHIERRGWQSYWESKGRAVKRLELAAKHYKSKWKEFIRDTSESSRHWRRHSGFTIGTVYLVHFLLLVGQEDVAAQFTETMVGITSAELNDQPIPALDWLR